MRGLLRARWRCAALACALALVACSSDDGTGGDRGSGNGGGASGAGGDGTGSGAGGGSNFGNTDDTTAPGTMLPDGGLPTNGDDAPDDRAVCDSAEIVPELETTLVPGNVLIVFDRSGSMEQNWGDPAMPKWVTARAAVTDALTPLQGDIALVGAILFPNPEAGGGECDVAPFTSGLQFNFVPPGTFLSQWDAYWMQPGVTPNGPTPLLYAEQQADVALLDPSLMNTTIVIIITDGAPNCVNGVGNADEPLANLTPLPASWLAAGVKTYVVGLPGSEDAIDILDGVAAAGGTGTHIPADDPATLQGQIAMIVQEAAIGESFPCFIDIDPAPDNPDDVHVVVTEAGSDSDVPRTFSNGDEAWSINGDGTHIDFHGDFCAAVMAGTYENVSVEFGCVSAPPLPPPKPE